MPKPRLRRTVIEAPPAPSISTALPTRRASASPSAASCWHELWPFPPARRHAARRGQAIVFPAAPHLLRGPQLQGACEGDGGRPEAHRRSSSRSPTTPSCWTAAFPIRRDRRTCITRSNSSWRLGPGGKVFGHAVGHRLHPPRPAGRGQEAGGRPWETAKSFDFSAPIGGNHPVCRGDDGRCHHARRQRHAAAVGRSLRHDLEGG